MLENKYKTEAPALDNGITRAKAIAFAPFDDIIPLPPPQTIVTVSIKLISVEHVADRGNEVGQNFDLELTVTDNGQNLKGEFGPVSATIPNGSTFSVDAFLPARNYSSLSAAQLKFDFRAETDFLSGVFIGNTVGDDALSPGVNTFVAPVVLETSSRKSTLLFRGRVDVTVLEGVNI